MGSRRSCTSCRNDKGSMRRLERGARDKYAQCTTPPDGPIVPNPPITREDFKICKERAEALAASPDCGMDAYDCVRARETAREFQSRPEDEQAQIARSEGIGGRYYERYPWSHHPNWTLAHVHTVVRVTEVYDKMYNIFRTEKIRACDGAKCLTFPMSPVAFDLNLLESDAETSRPDGHVGRRWPDFRTMPVSQDLVTIRKLARRYFVG